MSNFTTRAPKTMTLINSKNNAAIKKSSTQGGTAIQKPGVVINTGRIGGDAPNIAAAATTNTQVLRVNLGAMMASGVRPPLSANNQRKKQIVIP